MRVAVYTELYPPHVGGMEVRMSELAKALVARGHAVDVFCIRHDVAVPAESVEHGVRVRRYPTAPRYRRSLIPKMPRSVWAIARYARWARRTASAGAYDVYLFNQWPFGHLAVAPASVRERAITDWCEVRGGRLYGAFERRLPRRSARNMAVSREVAEGIAAASGQSVDALPTGVDTRQFRADVVRGGVLYVGRLFEHKRVPLLVEAFAKLRANGFTGTLTIAGDGPARTDVDRAVASLDAATRAAVQVMGYVDEAEKVRLLAAAAVLVLPSMREGFPNVVSEAMASSLPVVTTNDSGNGTAAVVREYGIGEVADPTPSAIADAVRTVLEDWPAYSQRAAAGGASLDWSALVVRFEEMAASLPSR